MKFKAKEKLTPERLRLRVAYRSNSKTIAALTYEPVNIHINASGFFYYHELKRLINGSSFYFSQRKKRPCDIETHCDADFY